MRKFTSCLLACFMCLSLIISASAVNQNDVHILQDVPPASEEIMPYGANPPSSSNGTHDLSSSDYDYTVTSVGAQVYTDRWLTGAKSIKCSVLGYRHTDGTTLLNYEAVTFSVYNSKGKLVSSNYADLGRWAGEDNGYGSCIVTGLSSSEKYYVKISVTQDNITRAFSGTISKYT
ncbi:MAG: hypothetical protein ACI3XZ_01285 [Butyricicoccus sp.]